jgi:hypothetical protein
MVGTTATATIVVTIGTSVVAPVIALLMPATIIMATAMAHVLRSMSIAAAGRRAGLRLDGQTAQTQAGGNGGRKNAGSQTGHGYSFVESFRSTRCAAVMATAADPSLPNFGAARSEQLPIYHFLRAVYRTETYEAPSRIWQAAINIH